MTIRAGGIKISPPLAQIDVAGGDAPDAGVAAFLAGLCAAQINLPFFTQQLPPAPAAMSLCVAAEECTRAEGIAHGLEGVTLHLTVHRAVVAVSVFPHRSQAVLLGAILQSLHRQELRVLGLATSLSALTFTLYADHLARALAALDEVLELPENHAPLRWELLVKQTPP